MRRALPFLVLLASCSSELAPRTFGPGEGVVAEVHLHQYASGSHAAAGFVRTHVPYRRELDEQLVQYASEPDARDGDCVLDLPSRCSPTCDGNREYCEGGACRAYTKLHFEDGGPVIVEGSSVVSPLTLTFDPRIPAYRSGRSANAPIFAAGDRLTIAAPSGQWAFRSEVVAPPIPEVTSTLRLPASGPLRIEWKQVSSSIAIRITAAARTGEGGTITCISDVDHGAATVPEVLLARLPPPPRDVTFSIERFERRFPSVGAREKVVVTVAATHVLETTD